MNIRDIARLANVTPGTVSKVLNNYPDISDNTKELVLKIIKEHQYTPNSNARMLKLSTKLPLIGLIIEGGNNPIYNCMEDVITSRLHNADRTILYFRDNYHIQKKSEKFDELVTYIKKNNLSGLIYIGGNYETISQEHFNELSCPVVFVNTVLPEHFCETNYSSVQVNHFETAYQQMNYLIQKGHVDICTVIAANEDNTVYNLRTQGYKKALQEHNLDHNFAHFIESHYICPKTYNELLSHLRKHPEITAVCSATDAVIPAIVRVIHDIKKIPGKDISIISFDGLDSMNYTVPSITTFSQPIHELCNCVYDLLFGLISKEKEHQHITFQTKLIENESCHSINQ